MSKEKALRSLARSREDLQQAIESRFAGVREGAVRELEHLIRGRDEALALAAKEALERLVDDDSRSVSAAAARTLRVLLKPLKDEPVSVPTTPAISKQPEARAERKPRSPR